MTDEHVAPPRVEVLTEAAGLIDGDRNVSYGTPTQNFTNIADMWTIQFRHMLKDGEKFEARHVADAMILLKTARSIAQPKRDNYVDIAGYAGCGWEATLPPEEPPTAKVKRRADSETWGGDTFVINLYPSAEKVGPERLAEIVTEKIINLRASRG